MSGHVIVTGGAGFIGSNIVKKLRENNYAVTVFDDLTNEAKFKNLVSVDIEDYYHKDQLINDVLGHCDFLEHCMAIIHFGANSSTNAKNGEDILYNNHQVSKLLAIAAQNYDIPFIYASSASVYGLNKDQKEDNEGSPLNCYAYSKLLFDQWVNKRLKDGTLTNRVVGLRPSNVYGQGEFYKNQPSPHFRFFKALKERRHLYVLYNNDGFDNDALYCKRDFVHVDDVTSVVHSALVNENLHGIFNVGSGEAVSFEEIAKQAITWWRTKKVRNTNSHILYKKFPEEMRKQSQPYTKLDLTKINRNLNYQPIDYIEGLDKYFNWLDENWWYYAL